MKTKESNAMNNRAINTEFPLQITFRNMQAQPEAERWVRLEATRLQGFYKRIMGCRVAVERPKQRRNGSPYYVRIDLTVPGGELLVRRQPSRKTRARQAGETQIRKQLEPRNPGKDLRSAIQDSFKAAARRLQDFARRQRGEIKSLQSLPSAKVIRIFPEKGYGFLLTPEGREIYFHQGSVLNRAFGRLKPGTTVTFAEEPGEQGPQASTVRVAPRRAVRQANKQPPA